MTTINALVAADSAIIPVQSHYLPLKGMTQLTKTIGKVRNKGCCYSLYGGIKILYRKLYDIYRLGRLLSETVAFLWLSGEDIIDLGLYGAFNSTTKPKKVCSACQKLADEQIWQMYWTKQINQIIVNKLFSREVYSPVRDNLIIDDLGNYSDNICLMSAFAFYARTYKIFRSITFDKGCEFAASVAFKSLGLSIYYAHPYSAWWARIE